MTVDIPSKKDMTGIGMEITDIDPDRVLHLLESLHSSNYEKQTTEPPRQKPSSQSSRSESHHRRHEAETSVVFELVITEPTGEEAIRIAQLKKDFPNICFDNYIFPPHLKRILAEAENTMHNYIHIYSQYMDESRRVSVEAGL